MLEDSRTPQRIWLWLAGITAVAAVLRAIGLDSSLWVDEMLSISSVRPPVSEILTVFRGDTQHPLYSLLAHLSISALGEDAWTLRLPAFLLGVATVPALYLLGAAIATRLEGLLAAGLLAVAYHHVWFSQNARGYSALAFWAVVSTYLLVRGLRQPGWGSHVAYAIVAALGVYTHLTMVFLVASHVAVTLWLLFVPEGDDLRVRDWRKQVAGFALAAAFTLLLYAPIMTQVLNFFLRRRSGLRGLSTPAWAFFEALRGLQIGFGANVVLLAAAVLTGCGMWSYLRQSRGVLFLLVLPGFMTFAGALAGRGTMYPRFFFYLLGFAILIMVRGAMVVARWLAGRRWQGAKASDTSLRLGTAFVILMIVVSALSLTHNYRYPKQDYEGAAAYVERVQQAGDQIVTVGETDFYRVYYGKPWESVKSAEQLQAAREQHRVWLLYTLPRYTRNRAPDLMLAIERDCPIVRVFRGTLGGGDIIVCRAERVGHAAQPQFQPVGRNRV